MDLTSTNQEDAQRAAKDLLGKDRRKMAKMSTTYLSATSITGLKALTKFFDNLMAAVSVLS